jgi:RNA polymerase sigma-70 factor (ECF subfamily)
MTASASSEDVTAPDAPPAPPDDAPPLSTLQDRLEAGDEAAFERIFRRLSPSVFRFVCGMVENEALADDITQDTFAKLWTIRDRMEKVESLKAYLFQMARHRVYNHQRAQQVRRDSEATLEDTHPDASPPPPDQSLDADMLRALLERWIAELPNRQREALTLRRQKHLSHDEIAEIMEISPSTVNNHLVRAMKALRGRLREHRPDLLA